MEIYGKVVTLPNLNINYDVCTAEGITSDPYAINAYQYATVPPFDMIYLITHSLQDSTFVLPGGFGFGSNQFNFQLYASIQTFKELNLLLLLF